MPPFFYYRYSVVSNAVLSYAVVSYVIVMPAFFLGLYFGFISSFIFDFILVLFLALSPLYRHFGVSVFLPGLDHIGKIKEIVPGIAGDDLFRFLIFYCRCCSGISRLFTLRGFLFFSESYGVQVLRPTTNFSWCFVFSKRPQWRTLGSSRSYRLLLFGHSSPKTKVSDITAG